MITASVMKELIYASNLKIRAAVAVHGKKIYVVLQDFVLGPLLFNIFQRYLFVIPGNTYCTSYADDKLPPLT